MQDFEQLKDLDQLRELASFEPKSDLASSDSRKRKSTLLRIAQNIAERSQQKTVAEMLGSVMAISARTRRVLHEPVSVELDVFNADGSRAVVLEFGQSTD
ncbi:hypothetical protein [Maritalea porphyrae]|jgi:hypothetical protein|uniref:hypothetical protein n=1 Tax=Maritalea porphyrae TaxID=880732 RepID=UPI0022AF3E2C|nr:hypothetical protein [Maritalea porphyrae]MCZ4272898.1 hypothetical protein [Maritalea porphyrae]